MHTNRFSINTNDGIVRCAHDFGAYPSLSCVVVVTLFHIAIAVSVHGLDKHFRNAALGLF